MLDENTPFQESKAPTMNEKLLDYAKKLGFGELHVKLDLETGLTAIVAIHSTKLGPSLGGCRFREYPTLHAAVQDALRLAQGMTYKAAITGLPLGGGKSVLIKPETLADRNALFAVFGQFIEDLGGRYITAVDSGTSPEDMDAIATKTNYVTSKSIDNGDPSPFTATGVRYAIEAAIKHKYGKDSLQNIHVAIQGVGHVGYDLAKELHERGARLTVTDTNLEALNHCATEFGAEVVSTDVIHSVPCDVFAPCALGAIINDLTIPQLQTEIIVGSANNQLAEPRHGEILHENGILYGPDYVVNAGGLIYACAQYYKTEQNIVEEQVKNIYHTTTAIFERSARDNRPTSEVADTIAEEKLQQGEKA